MLRQVLTSIYGVFMTLVLLLTTTFWGFGVFLCAIPKILIPHPRWQRWMTYGVDFFAMSWTNSIAFFSKLSLPTQWDIRGAERIRKDQTYLLAANHQSWNDLVAMIVAFQWRIPPYRLFIKAPLIWLPIVGQACWAMDAAFMKRYSRAQIVANPSLQGRDLATAKRTFERSRHKSVAVFNFIEGTRVSAAKHAAQQSPYKHLLKPRAGGVAFAMQAMGDQLDHFVDVTFVYPYGSGEIWELLCGRVKYIVVEIIPREIPEQFRGMDYANDPAIKEEFKVWLEALWAEKDQRIEQIGREVRGDAAPKGFLDQS